MTVFLKTRRWNFFEKPLSPVFLAVPLVFILWINKKGISDLHRREINLPAGSYSTKYRFYGDIWGFRRGFASKSQNIIRVGFEITLYFRFKQGAIHSISFEGSSSKKRFFDFLYLLLGAWGRRKGSPSHTSASNSPRLSSRNISTCKFSLHCPPPCRAGASLSPLFWRVWFQGYEWGWFLWLPVCSIQLHSASL